jgi:hypothetical protein
MVEILNFIREPTQNTVLKFALTSHYNIFESSLFGLDQERLPVSIFIPHRYYIQ